MVRFSALFQVLGCARPEAQAPPLLPPVARATRVSLALRGVRPSLEELTAIAADPGDDVLAERIDAWLADPAFGATVRDLHAEVLSIRADTEWAWPAVGDLADSTRADVFTSISEAPLVAIERVVLDGRPYTDIVRERQTWADARLAKIEGMAYDPNGPEWQPSHFGDGRPEAGILSATGLWQRWWTNESGKHRNRANLLTKALLCDEIGARDMPVSVAFDPTDDAATADQLRTDPACLGCHQDLDPLAAYFWGFELSLFGEDIEKAEGVAPGSGYPVSYWSADRAGNYALFGLPGPGYYGEPGTDLHDLGRGVSSDPRFASCAVAHAWAYFVGDPDAEVPEGVLAAGTAALVGSGWDWREMARALVTSPAFLAEGAPVLQLRPEQASRTLAAGFGFRWTIDDPGWGEVDAFTSSRVGARDLGGGTDGFKIRRGNTTPSVINLEIWNTAARLAADASVGSGLVGAPIDADAVRGELVAVVGRAWSAVLRPDDPEIDALYALFVEASAGSAPEAAWREVVRAALLDPRAWTY